MNKERFVSNNDPISKAKSFILYGALLWTIVLSASLVWNIGYTKNQTLAKADLMVRLTFDKDMTFRTWVTSHGGVYSAVADEITFNPHFGLSDEDEVLRTGKSTALMNPIYVLRQYYERFQEWGAVKGHIAGVKSLRPENKPDPWEEESLRAFEAGKKEATAIKILDGAEYVRFMLPIVADKRCLKCHAAEGCKEGGILGGISVSVPMEPLRNLERNHIFMLSGVHALLWGIGLGGIALFGKGILKSENGRAKSERELRMSEEKLATIFQASPDWITIMTPEDGQYIDVNQAFLSITGYEREEVIGRTPDELGLWIDEDQRQEVTGILKESGNIHNLEVAMRMKSGVIRCLLWSVESIGLGGQRYLVCVAKDITIRKELEQEIKRMAYYDRLTGLPNRTLLIDRFTIAMSQAERNEKKVAFMVLDLDRFKEVNDTLGHLVGDLLLNAVAGMLREILRKADTVARFGGDEFVIVLPEQKDSEGALEVARKIVDAFTSPFHIEGNSLNITTSIGISFYPDDGGDIDTILKNADSAMYIAKTAGRNRYSVYRSHEESLMKERPTDALFCAIGQEGNHPPGRGE